MNKWTPGEWVAIGDRVFLNNRVDYRELICDCNGTHNAFTHARLIAAAPRMAKLLQDIVQSADSAECQEDAAYVLSIRADEARAILAEIEK
jgi:hypothetical protein